MRTALQIEAGSGHAAGAAAGRFRWDYQPRADATPVAARPAAVPAERAGAAGNRQRRRARPAAGGRWQESVVLRSRAGAGVRSSRWTRRCRPLRSMLLSGSAAQLHDSFDISAGWLARWARLGRASSRAARRRISATPSSALPAISLRAWWCNDRLGQTVQLDFSRSERNARVEPSELQFAAARRCRRDRYAAAIAPGRANHGQAQLDATAAGTCRRRQGLAAAGRSHAAAPLEEFVGQTHLLAPGKPLYEAIASGQPHSLILWGPPGTGKTTLARLIADRSQGAVHRAVGGAGGHQGYPRCGGTGTADRRRRASHGAVPRRSASLQQGAAGRFPAACRGRYADLHRRDHRESIVRDRGRAAVARAGVRAQGAERRGAAPIAAGRAGRPRTRSRHAGTHDRGRGAGVAGACRRW